MEACARYSVHFVRLAVLLVLAVIFTVIYVSIVALVEYRERVTSGWSITLD